MDILIKGMEMPKDGTITMDCHLGLIGKVVLYLKSIRI